MAWSNDTESDVVSTDNPERNEQAVHGQADNITEQSRQMRRQPREMHLKNRELETAGL
jgi:hypothetical protein